MFHIFGERWVQFGMIYLDAVLQLDGVSGSTLHNAQCVLRGDYVRRVRVGENLRHVYHIVHRLVRRVPFHLVTATLVIP